MTLFKAGDKVNIRGFSDVCTVVDPKPDASGRISLMSHTGHYTIYKENICEKAPATLDEAIANLKVAVNIADPTGLRNAVREFLEADARKKNSARSTSGAGH